MCGLILSAKFSYSILLLTVSLLNNSRYSFGLTAIDTRHGLFIFSTLYKPSTLLFVS